MILHWFSFLNPDLSLSLGTTPGLHDRVPSLDFGSGGRVGLEVPTRAGHVLNERLKSVIHQWLVFWTNIATVPITASTQEERGKKLTAFQGGDNCFIMTSSVGASLRMWWIQECHSGGTWEALKSS